MRKSARPSPADKTRGQRTSLLDSLLRIAGVYTAYEKWLTQQVKGRPLPEHIGIILDGNRRWAEENALRPNDGHIIGAKVGEEVLDWCLEYGIKTLTLYTFSTENFDRPAEEVNAVLKLVEEEARKLGRDKRLHTQKVRVKALGRTDLLPESLQDALKKLEDETSQYSGHFLTSRSLTRDEQRLLTLQKRSSTTSTKDTYDPRILMREYSTSTSTPHTFPIRTRIL